MAPRRVLVVSGLVVAAFAFNTTENLPVGLLRLMAADLHVSLPWVGYLITGYGLTVAVVSVPLARLTRRVPRRALLAVLLGALVVATVVSVVGGLYPVLLATRVATAVAQALFWAVSGTVAVGLFPPERRGRVMAVLSVGGSLATVAGVPAGTWFGQHAGWRAPFLVIAALGLGAMVVIGTLLPTTPPEAGHAAHGSAPDRRRFGIVVAGTALSVVGMFTGFTYLTAYLGRVGLSAVGPLLVFGVAGLTGVAVTGAMLDRAPRVAPRVLVGAQAVALVGLGLAGGRAVLTVALTAVLGVCAAPVFMATQARMMEVAPGRTETALAANSAGYNVGVAGGALVGGVALPVFGAAGLFVLGGAVTLGSLAVLCAEALSSGRGGAAMLARPAEQC